MVSNSDVHLDQRATIVAGAKHLSYMEENPGEACASPFLTICFRGESSDSLAKVFPVTC